MWLSGDWILDLFKLAWPIIYQVHFRNLNLIFRVYFSLRTSNIKLKLLISNFNTTHFCIQYCTLIIQYCTKCPILQNLGRAKRQTPVYVKTYMSTTVGRKFTYTHWSLNWSDDKTKHMEIWLVQETSSSGGDFFAHTFYSIPLGVFQAI
jgi:hypothetical protein